MMPISASAAVPPFALDEFDAQPLDSLMSISECEQMISDALHDSQDLLYGVAGRSGSSTGSGTSDFDLSDPSSGLQLTPTEADWLNFDVLSNDIPVHDAPLDYSLAPDLVVAETMTAAEALRNIDNNLTCLAPTQISSRSVHSSCPTPSIHTHDRRWFVDESTARRQPWVHERSLSSSPSSGPSSLAGSRPQATFVLPSPLMPVPSVSLPKPQPPKIRAPPRTASRESSTYVLPSSTRPRSTPRASSAPYSSCPPPKPVRKTSLQEDAGVVFVNYVLASDGEVISSSSRPRSFMDRQRAQRSRSYISASSTPQFYRDGAGHRPMTIC